MLLEMKLFLFLSECVYVFVEMNYLKEDVWNYF